MILQFLDATNSLRVDSSTILFNPSHPWWDWAVFNSYNEAVLKCNVSSANIFIIGQSDPFLAFDGLPAPFHVYTEVFNAVVPLAFVNQSNTLTIIGDFGMTILANGHHLSNPHNRTVILQGIEFVDAGVTGPPIWDFTNAALFTNLITLRNNLMVGNGSATNRAIDGTFDGLFKYQSNVHVNWSTTFSNARFTAENCAAEIRVERAPGSKSGNTWSDMTGNVAELHTNNGAFSNNVFMRCGGSSVPADPDRWVAFVNPTCIGVVGNIKMDGNRFTKPAVVDTNPSRTLWTSLYVDPVPWNLHTLYLAHASTDTKFLSFYDTRTDGLQVGLRLDHVNVKCVGAGDPQNFLRLVVYSRFRNSRVDGSVFDLYIGAFDVFEEQTVIANRDAHINFDIIDATACQHCEDGCPLFYFALATLILLGIALLIPVLFLCFYGYCAERIGCCPCARPNTLRYDTGTGKYISSDWRTWYMMWPWLFPANLRTGGPAAPLAATVGTSPYDQSIAGETFNARGVTQGQLVHRGVLRGAGPIVQQ